MPWKVCIEQKTELTFLGNNQHYVIKLINVGANPNATDKFPGLTPLMMAIKDNDMKLIKILLGSPKSLIKWNFITLYRSGFIKTR